MSVYPGIDRMARRRELDRRTWAESEIHVFTHEPVFGTGYGRLHTVDFLTVFEGQPLFHWAVELHEDSVPLLDGSYPQVQAGVAEWVQTDFEPHEGGVALYSGATVFMGAKRSTGTQAFNFYKFRFQFGFEGVVFKNVSTLR